MTARADSLTITQPYGLGRGTVEAVTFATPAAQANFTRTTASGYWERYISLFFLFTTDANAANRIIAIEVQDGDGNVVGGAAPSQVQTASLAGRFYGGFAYGTSNAAGVIRQAFALPQMFLQPSWKLVSNVANMQVGDTLTLIRAVVERFGIGPDGTPVGETADIYTERGRGYARALESE